MEILAKRIRKRRKELGMKTADIARTMGKCRRTIQMWQRTNGYVPRLNDVIKLCDVLKCTPNYLFGWEEEA